MLLKWWKARKQRILEEEAEMKQFLNKQAESKQKELDSRLNAEREDMFSKHCPFENKTCNHNRNCVHYREGYSHAYIFEGDLQFFYEPPCCLLWKSN